MGDRPSHRLEGPFGDVMRVLTGRGHVQRDARCLNQRLKRVGHHPLIGAHVDVGGGTAGEVDDRVREGFVHRNSSLAVASEPSAVAEGTVERLTEGSHHVFDGVVVAGLEIPTPSRRRSIPA